MALIVVFCLCVCVLVCVCVFVRACASVLGRTTFKGDIGVWAGGLLGAVEEFEHGI
jgi:hypothetical protein